MVSTHGPWLKGLLARRETRWAWRIGGSVLALVVLGFGTVQAVSALAHEQDKVTRRFDASGVTTLEISNDAGQVRVVGGTASGGPIKVTAEISDGLRETSHREWIDGPRLQLRASCPILSTFCNLNYTVEVPRDVSVLVHRATKVSIEDLDALVDVRAEGTIEVARLGAGVKLHSGEGSVTGRELRSLDVDASSTEGSVVLEFAVPPQAVVAHSSEGRVEVVVPRGSPSYRVETSSNEGDVSNVVDTRMDADRAIAATTTEGDVTVRYANE